MNWKNNLTNTLKLFGFWLLFFQLGRIIFICYHADKIFNNSLIDVLKIFPYSLRLDVSSASYIMGFPVVIIFLISIFGPRLLEKIINIYSYIIIVCIGIICTFELELYNEWGVKLNYKAIKYLAHPSEMFSTASVSVTFITLLFLTLYLYISIKFYNRYFKIKYQSLKRHWLFPIPYLLVFSFFIGVGLRGGLQQIPINQSECYFSSDNDLNVAATNSFWNFMNSIYQNWEVFMKSNPYQYYTDEEAQQTIKDLYKNSQDSIIHILNTDRPNIVFVILESWSADLLKFGGVDSGLVTNFEKLCSQGYYFNQCYATGERSDQGMAAIWSSFPSQPLHSIISQPDKFQRLPSMVNHIKKAGYYTSYMFGGQLIYGNIKGYMMYNNFDQIKEGKDFDGYREGKLGIHDGDMFEELLKECDHSKAPFFNTLFTLSTHAPYDQPCSNPIQRGGTEQRYYNAAYYTDSCIHTFMEAAKKKPWYKNTLFVFIADHSHNTPAHMDMVTAGHHHIPLLFYGDVIKKEFQGKIDNRIVSQLDLTKGILSQLNIPSEEFQWSQNLFNLNNKQFAYMVFDDGVTWKNEIGELSVHHGINNKLINIQVKDSTQIPMMSKQAKSYLQEVFRQYLSK